MISPPLRFDLCDCFLLKLTLEVFPIPGRSCFFMVVFFMVRRVQLTEGEAQALLLHGRLYGGHVPGAVDGQVWRAADTPVWQEPQHTVNTQTHRHTQLKTHVRWMEIWVNYLFPKMRRFPLTTCCSRVQTHCILKSPNCTPYSSITITNLNDLRVRSCKSG